MKVPLKLLLFAALFVPLLCGCSELGINLPMSHDPLTGGQNATTSLLLGVPLPRGLQRYSSHSYISGSPGARHGLETLRGNIDANDAAISMFNGLHADGWNLRMRDGKGDRSIHIYQKGKELAVVAFHKQGILTIMEIWLGSRLDDGAALSQATGEDSLPSIAGEEFGPLDGPEDNADQNYQESWGTPRKIEERAL